MAWRRLRNVLAQTEFKGFFGDCTDDALDTALHSAFPNEFPVTGAELNALVHQTLAATPPEAGPSGSMDPAQLAWLIGQLKDPTGAAIPFSQRVTPNWQDYTTFTAPFQALVQQWGGIRPIVIQLAHGEWLPGSWSNPKGAAIGHAVALTGFDPATGAAEIADGNSSYGGNGQVSPTDLATLTRALPYAVTMLDVDASATNASSSAGSATGPTGDYPPMLSITDPTVARYFSLTASGAWQSRDTGKLMANAILTYYTTHDGLARFGLPLGNESYPVAGAAVQPFERGAIAWDPKRQLDTPPVAASDQCYAAHIDTGVVLAWLETALHAQLTAAQAAQSAAQAAAQQAQDALTQAQTQLAAQAQADATASATATQALQGQLSTAQDAATAAQQQRDAASAQVTQLQAQLATVQAEAGKGAALVEALKAALAA